ncbi:MAG TPA: aminotransferase class V-fold PLP-dependent enzyme [Oscillatoriaceae cyanobacterium M33_DOE_052]|uniref:Aminotransferase class V-fold PLP-dependent enzyme n=1 Tax=Planktothricoides sp. SpSt-374 TaxID=2282167 RepID=A0A7C3VSK8_9CYAN|nr:aminotransferase class V-fold PLP-dependent enzyme [Oscillatoriaceae cyanobacterium M33_DOE_052]
MSQGDNLQDNQWQGQWLLASEVTFLNHGSFGACPWPVLQAQQRLQSRLEKEPVRFFAREWEPLLDEARNQLADFVGAAREDVVFVANATMGVNAVLRSLRFQPGDEILTTDHLYNACRNALEWVAATTNARIVVAPVPFPLADTREIVTAVMDRVSPRTKLAVLDHITSQTALVFPIASLVRKLAAVGVDTLVDGAQAPGAVSLNLAELGAAYYTGNCHKWLCAPKGSGFLYVRRDKQEMIRPPVISHGANSPRTDKSRFQLEFDWMGTDDPTPYLCLPVVLEFMGSLVEGGWPGLMAQNRDLALQARRLLADGLGVQLPCPEGAIGSMAVVPLPETAAQFPAAALQDALYDQYQIQVKINPPWGDDIWLIRVSAQIYNHQSQYEKLLWALKQLLHLV